MTFVFRFSTVAVVIVLATKVGFVAVDVAHREEGLPIEKRVARLLDEATRCRAEWEESFEGSARMVQYVSIVRHRLTKIFDWLAASVVERSRVFAGIFVGASHAVSGFLLSMDGGKPGHLLAITHAKGGAL
ncbi:hypothetical protein [Acidithiobacillus ferridurans]|uniref:Uncharacterized protein n=1 Tax=Acidithiobacillus ferridurans TaxID=1232575 RepID=A0A8X8G6P2_ACIFI|nr:hypothetical protein [Acidithiobacillus ferridurans]MBU2715865.1 hypothetical protein [Acidithiobacillus ferridurans]MBU2722669.1 hypothetical protein [Acidithiobacillus ferridurans]MBU2728054.1 hypothetical protein [Acidithiobacillus ferridurans]MDA8376487.1 hypothetical protein [Planctomycetia bacterium]